MISKELFCELLRRRDTEFSRLCRITSVLEDIFTTASGKMIDVDAVFCTLDLLSDAMSAVFNAPNGLIQISIGLENPEDTDMTEIEERLPDGTVCLIHDYAELYDYLMARREQLGTVDQ